MKKNKEFGIIIMFLLTTFANVYLKSILLIVVMLELIPLENVSKWIFEINIVNYCQLFQLLI